MIIRRTCSNLLLIATTRVVVTLITDQMYDYIVCVLRMAVQLHSSNFDSSNNQLLHFVADLVDIEEAKAIFETNYSHVYFILYDTFVQAEGNLRQRGKFSN